MNQHKEDPPNALCSICHIATSKYQCPGCGTRTCSLKCFNNHKSQLNCSGKSDVSLNKTRYLSRDAIDSNNVQRDYNFLMKMDRKMEITRKEANSNRIITSASRKRYRQNRYHGGQNKMIRTSNDDENVYIRRGVRIRQLPPGMTRKLQNKSGFDKQKGRFLWTVEWVLVDDEFKEVERLIRSGNDEESRIGEITPWGSTEKRKGSEREVGDRQVAQSEAASRATLQGGKEDSAEDATGDATGDVTEDATENATGDATGDVTEDATEDTVLTAGEDTAGATADTPVDSTALTVATTTQFLIYSDDRQTLIDIPGETPLNKALLGRLFIEFPTIYVSLSGDVKAKTIVRFGGEEEEEEEESSTSSSPESSSESSSDSGPEESTSRAPDVPSDDANYCPSEDYIP